MTEMNDEYMDKVIRAYKKKQEADKLRYEKFRNDDTFKQQNRERAKAHYQNTKEDRKDLYINNKAFMNAKSSYYYYRRKDNLEGFKTKYPDRVALLEENGIHLS